MPRPAFSNSPLALRRAPSTGLHLRYTAHLPSASLCLPQADPVAAGEDTAVYQAFPKTPTSTISREPSGTWEVGSTVTWLRTPSY